MRCCAAHRIERIRADDEVEVGALRSKRIVAWRFKSLAGLPPAMLADDDTRIETIVQPHAGAHAPLRRLDRYPVAVRKATLARRGRMQGNLRVEGMLAQARQCAVLRLAKHRGLCTSQG